MEGYEKHVAAKRAMRQLRKHLDALDRNYLANEDGTLRGLWGGGNVQWHWWSRAEAEGRALMFHSYSPVFVSPERRAAVAEFITRANWGNFFSTLDMDWKDGQVACRTSTVIGPKGTTAVALERLVDANEWMMANYLPGVLDVALGAKTAEEAIAEADKRFSAPPAEETGPSDATPQDGGEANWPNRFTVSEN